MNDLDKYKEKCPECKHYKYKICCSRQHSKIIMNAMKTGVCEGFEPRKGNEDGNED